jgi:hypothetical protein
MKILPNELAKFMHDRYEEHSKQEGWETQSNCRVEFDDLPIENKSVMILVAKDVIGKLKEN